VIRILVTGANSYVGTSFVRHLSQWTDRYLVDTIDMIDSAWRGMSFAGYDAVFHVAGIAHSEAGKVNEKNRKLYFQVNTDLTIETAQKAKNEGVKQFIFMSSAIVYGASAPIGKSKIITWSTPVCPINNYGNSKVQAENGIKPLNGNVFKVVVLRPPMIYGKGCKGNYPLLSKMALKLPVFPYVNNQRSMIHIDNLVEFVRLMIENKESGTFWPQNAEYVNTSEIVKMIATAHGKQIIFVKGFGFVLKLLSRFTGLANKAFGNLIYDQEMSAYQFNYQIRSLSESIEVTES
jgi:UDP-glucose 4-epimerase